MYGLLTLNCASMEDHMVPGQAAPNTALQTSGRTECACRSMYGLLMLLPQSTAFKTLHARLHSVPALALLQLDQCSSPGGAPAESSAAEAGEPSPSPFKHHVDYPAMLKLFRQLQVATIPCVGAHETLSCPRWFWNPASLLQQPRNKPC